MRLPASLAKARDIGSYKTKFTDVRLHGLDIRCSGLKNGNGNRCESGTACTAMDTTPSSLEGDLPTAFGAHAAIRKLMVA